LDALADIFHPDITSPNFGKRSAPKKDSHPLFQVGARPMVRHEKGMEPLWARLDRRISDRVAA
jgi:hypothetical protein